jgi:putative DNA primase/helicase
MNALELRLRDFADVWVPRAFPQGWRSDSGDEWVVGDISGKRASGNGSCRIKLRGDHAGDHYDFSSGKGGQVFSTIKERFRLGAGEAVPEALRIIEECGVTVERIEGKRPRREPGPSQAIRNVEEARSTWENEGSVPLAPDSEAARYFNIYRGLPLPKSDVLRFNPAIRRTRNNQLFSQAAIIALFQLPDGTATAIHRIYLTPDGRRDGDRMMLGPARGAVIMLGQPRRGLLGIGEGIETTLAASLLFSGVPGWAAGSDDGLRKFGEWLVTHPGWAWQAGIRRLLIWADAKRAGETAGRDLLAACRTAGVDAQLYLPRGGDDFNDDLLKGLLPSVPVATTRDTETLSQREPGEFEPDCDWSAT